MYLQRKLTTAIKWDGAVTVFLMEGDLYVRSAKADLAEGQSSHISPVLKGSLDGCFHL